MVEYLKVQLTYWPPQISQKKGRACLRILSLMVEYLKVLNSRAPKGDGGLNSRACLRILSLMVEYLKVLNSRAPKGSIYLLGGGYGRACLRILNSRAPDGPYGRAPKGPMVERLRSLSVESLTYSFYLLAPQIKSKKGRVT
jgi:hypothetical protein